jgi:quaternary ammonium compound-resistance protein SugE
MHLRAIVPRMNPWAALVLAGIFEIGFTSSMKMADRPSASGWWTGLFWVSVISSFALLSQAIKTIPLGTAYAVWTGIGAVGTAVIGIVFFKDPATFWRLLFLTLLIGSIVGLKVVTK